MMTEELRNTTGLSKGAQRDLSLSEWFSFMEDLQLVPEDIFTSTYSLFGFELLHNYYLDI